MLRLARVETQTAMEASTLTLLREVHHMLQISTMVMTSIVVDTCRLRMVPVARAVSLAREDSQVREATHMFTQWMLKTR